MILEQLLQHNYTIKSYTSRSITVLTDKPRQKVIQDIQTLLNCEYDPTPCSASSIGKLICGKISILVKPANKQGRASSFNFNEDILNSNINNYSKKYGKINVSLITDTEEETISNVTHSTCVGADTKNRQKTDIRLHTPAKDYNISLKMDSAAFWESADCYFRYQAREILTKLLAEQSIKLEHVRNNIHKISPAVLIQSTREEARDIIFGNDIENNGAVVIKTFSDSDFYFDTSTKHLSIKCSRLITTLENVDINTEAYFMIRNDSTRSDSILPGYRGLRILAGNHFLVNRKSFMVDLKWRAQHQTQG